MQILLPLAGKSPFFPAEHYFFPKPLIEVDGQPMIERVIRNLKKLDADPRFVFVLPEQDIVRFSLNRTLSLLAGEGTKIVGLRDETQGALCSALMAVDELDLEAPLVIANADQVLEIDLNQLVREFRDGGAKAGVPIFDSIHPRWSYVATDNDGNVQQAAEKQPISRHAVAGLYFFETARVFVDAAMASIEANASHNGLFYIAPCLNEIILNGGRVASKQIDGRSYHSFYSPEKINHYEDEILRATIASNGNPNVGRVNLVIPAAGEGSRFRDAGYALPKPFIDVQGQPMIEHVIANTAPEGAQIHLLLRASHLDSHSYLLNGTEGRKGEVHTVDTLTEGTACTILLARSEFDDDQPLLIANSDQWVDFDVDDFVRDCHDRNLDGSILVFRDAERNPKWSFACVDDNGLVTEVAEKKPISDLATVGIYLFARGSDFVNGAVDMIARNDRVNGEFYTCPVYNYLIDAGLRIGVYEVPADAMHGLGTPADLDKFLAGPIDLSKVGRAR
ncbi:MAG: glycosyltransferase family 2 protein [Erythrobacter sp.]|nr:glycosyltransferase family 2 protein [Erythrobacter sp.]